MVELEAFDMELKTASEVKKLFMGVCSRSNGSNADSAPAPEQGANSEVTQDAVNSILAIVGGEASFKALMAWAAQNLTPEQLEGLKEILKSGDMAKIKEVLLALQKAFIESQSYENYRLF